MADEPIREFRARMQAERQRIRSAPRELRAQLARELRDTERELRQEARDARRSGRAPAMSVEDRRVAIVQVALPLLVEREGNVTTSEIAAAAGIAEGTLFRAFGDKRGLLIACYQAALESDREVARIRAIDRDLPLAQRFLLAAAAVADWHSLIWGALLALHAAGIDSQSVTPTDEENGKPGMRPKAVVEISQAVADLMSGDPLRTSPQLAARMLLGLVFSNRMRVEGFGPAPVELAEIVDIFLHGIMQGGKETDE